MPSPPRLLAPFVLWMKYGTSRRLGGGQCHIRETALLYGLKDRGALLPGLKADVNLIDFDRLGSRAPEIVFDFPANGKRFVQRAEGYKYTIASGEVVFHNGEPTGNAR
jgi:N-acyl-D-aspartate/D-glutamate deacylase